MTKFTFQFVTAMAVFAGAQVQADMILSHAILETAYPGYICNNSYDLFNYDSDFSCYTITKNNGKFQVVLKSRGSRSNHRDYTTTTLTTANGESYNLQPVDSEQEALRQLNVKANIEYTRWSAEAQNAEMIKFVESDRKLKLQEQLRPALPNAPTYIRK